MKDIIKRIIAETRMPAAVAKQKQKMAAMSPEELHSHIKSVAGDRDLKMVATSMAWRHGHGAGSSHYWDKIKSKAEGVELNEVVSDEGMEAHRKAGHRVKVHPDGKSYTWYDDEKRIGRKVTAKGQMSVKYSTKSGKDEDDLDESIDMKTLKENSIMEDPKTDEWWKAAQKAADFNSKMKENKKHEASESPKKEKKEHIPEEYDMLDEDMVLHESLPGSYYAPSSTRKKPKKKTIKQIRQKTSHESRQDFLRNNIPQNKGIG